MFSKHFSRLYWKIAGLFAAVIILLAALFLWISTQSSLTYFEEARQRLNAEVAEHIAWDSEPYIEMIDGEISDAALEDLYHHVMVLHPSIEIYLLDPEGRILAYSAPDSLIKLERVNLEPIEAFIQSGGDAFVKGQDPRHPGTTKAFSAAPVTRSEEAVGYVYVILGGDEYVSATEGLFETYAFRLARNAALIALAAALIIGLLAFLFITRNLNRVIRQIRAFRVGQQEGERVRMNASGDLKPLADTFNHMADTIEEKIRNIEELEQARSDLVANISHDLRTPLSTIQGYAETLLVMQDTLPDEDKERYTRTILNSAIRMKKLANELFELSRLENKEIEPHPEPFSISELVQDNIQKFKGAERNVSLETDFPEKVPLVYADVGLMDRVLQNLLDNALKFTPDGGKVSVGLRKSNGRAVRVAVEDNGVGIAPEALPTIFDRYMKSPRNSEDSNGLSAVPDTAQAGAGLGLAIVRSILELHQIGIQVESEVDKGSRFWFEVPVYR